MDIQGLQKIGIDTDEGIAYCADDPEFYEEMLNEYVANEQTGLDELKKAYALHDWNSYGIRAHTIKSTSRMIGAKELSEMARQMEMAAKAGDEDAVNAMHESFLNTYCLVADGIRGSIG